MVWKEREKNRATRTESLNCKVVIEIKFWTKTQIFILTPAENQRVKGFVLVALDIKPKKYVTV